jgi:transposase
MSFIRKIKKGKYTYLAEVEGKRINGKVVQKHIRYVGKELNGKIIKTGSIEDTEVTKVTTWAPLMILDCLAKEINLSDHLGDYGDYLLSLAYAHCLEPKSLNKMKDWYERTDLHNILNINELSEKKLYHALDSIDDKNSMSIQKNIFNSVKEKYRIDSKGYAFDVTNVYFYGSECPIAKKGKSKEGKNRPQIQIGLVVTEKEGIPIFHKTYEGNIIDPRIFQDLAPSLHDLNIKDLFIVWDRGISSEENIIDARRAGFHVICGLSIRLNIKDFVKDIKEKRDLLNFKNRIRLKKSVFYCTKRKFKHGSVEGYAVICYNEEMARFNKEKLLDDINKAKEFIEKDKPIPDYLKKYFKDKSIDENKIKEDLEFEGYFMLFSTKDMSIDNIVRQYFDKDKVEKAFRCLKSSLGIRPVKHWLEERVKAHVFICYLSYLLISLLESKLSKKEISSANALDKLSTAYKIHLKNKRLKNEFTKIVTISNEQKEIIKAVDKKILKCCV